jgi:hypothetical protein
MPDNRTDNNADERVVKFQEVFIFLNDFKKELLDNSYDTKVKFDVQKIALFTQEFYAELLNAAERKFDPAQLLLFKEFLAEVACLKNDAYLLLSCLSHKDQAELNNEPKYSLWLRDAILAKRMEIIKFFLQNGVDPAKKWESHRTPFEEAALQLDNDIFQMTLACSRSATPEISYEVLDILINGFDKSRLISFVQSEAGRILFTSPVCDFPSLAWYVENFANDLNVSDYVACFFNQIEKIQDEQFFTNWPHIDKILYRLSSDKKYESIISFISGKINEKYLFLFFDKSTSLSPKEALLLAIKNDHAFLWLDATIIRMTENNSPELSQTLSERLGYKKTEHQKRYNVLLKNAGFPEMKVEEISTTFKTTLMENAPTLEIDALLANARAPIPSPFFPPPSPVPVSKGKKGSSLAE